jgi:hypothetical protein
MRQELELNPWTTLIRLRYLRKLKSSEYEIELV